MGNGIREFIIPGAELISYQYRMGSRSFLEFKLEKRFSQFHMKPVISGKAGR